MSAYSRRGFGSSNSRVRYLGGGHGRGKGRGRSRGHGHYSNSNPGSYSGHDSFEGNGGNYGQFMDERDAGPSHGHSRCSGSGSVDRGRSSSRDRVNGSEAENPNRPPRHLRGAAIGLWYRNRQVQRNLAADPTGATKKVGIKNNLFAASMSVNLSEGRRTFITQLLEQLGSLTPSTHSLDATDDHRSRGSANPTFQWNYMQNLAANASTLQNDNETYPKPLESSRDRSLDETLKSEFSRSFINPTWLAARKALPAFDCAEAIVELVVENQVIVISGETGSGKTTQVGQFILDRWIRDGNGSLCNILCTQPRRISAISVAQRVAEERGEIVGGKSIGYSIRLESKLPKRSGGTITFCTTGVVLQHLKSDPYLNHVSHIVIDEVHERDVLVDFLLAIVKDLVPKRPDLKVILMSATLNAEHFQNYFNGCPRLHIPGVIHPVTVYHLEDTLEKLPGFMFPSKTSNRFNPERKMSRKSKRAVDEEQLKYDNFILPYIKKLERKNPGQYSYRTINQIRRAECEELNLDLIEALIHHICTTDTSGGSILVFLPGWDNISNLHKQMTAGGKFSNDRFLIIPLHSMMPTVSQREVFNRPPPGVRKIIIATNIAETSITIDDIVTVIDCGRIKMNNFDIDLNIETLSSEWVSLANAKQRRGRAGRVQAGVCYHLFTKGREATLREFMKPEVLRKRLEEVVLQIKILKLGKAREFFLKLMDPPDPRSVDLAVARLVQLNALDENEDLTPLGFHLAQLPMDPMTGRMILLGAIFSCLDPILSVAASLSFKDAFYTPLGHEKKVDQVKQDIADGSKSDHLVLARAIRGYEDAKFGGNQREYCYNNYMSGSTLNMLINLKGQFAQNLRDLQFLPSTDYRDPQLNANSQNDALVKAIICAGLYPNVGKIKMRKFPVAYTLQDGRVTIHPKSVNAREKSFESPFIVYHQKMKTSSIMLYDTTMASPLPLVFFGGQLNFLKENGADILKVDESIKFYCPQNIHVMIDELRAHLDHFLERKILNPGPTFWNRKTPDGDLLKAIVDLITAENKAIMNEDNADSENDEDDEDLLDVLGEDSYY